MRFKGGFLTTTYDTNKRFPLDSRMLVSKKAELIDPSIWLVNGQTTNALYNGLITSVNNDTDNNGIYFLLNRLAITEENYNNYETAVADGAPTEEFFSMWVKIADVDFVNGLITNLDANLTEKIDTNNETLASELNNIIKQFAKYQAIDYEIATLPEQSSVDYRGKEIRVLCPKDTNWQLQSVGPEGDSNSYYIALRAYAPENAYSFKEDLQEIITDDEMYYFTDNDFAGVDELGRKYSIVYLPVANFANDQWTYYGAMSSNDKYIGWYYSVEWYDVNGKLINSDTIRINLANEDCFNNIKDFYFTESVKALIEASLENLTADVQKNTENIISLSTLLGAPAADNTPATGLHLTVENLQKTDQTILDKLGAVPENKTIIGLLEETKIYIDKQDKSITDAIAGITHFSVEVIDNKDEVKSEGVLYLIKDDDTLGSDKYYEYLLIGGLPILIGDTSTDLTNYITNDALLEALNDYLTKSAFEETLKGYSTTNEIISLLNPINETLNKKVDSSVFEETINPIKTILAGIGGEEEPATVIEAIDKKIEEIDEYELQAATDVSLGGIKVSKEELDNTVSLNENNVAIVPKVNVETLTMDEGFTLILNGGSAQ